MNLSVSKGNDGQGGIDQIKTYYLREPVGGRLALIGSTPIWKKALTVAMNVHSVCSIMFAIHDNNQQMEITSTSIVIKSLEKKYNLN
ncbi:unnamed protein product [Prunus armeniaca]|uniref:Uncharacterized protein n=1 Tax=Prunus armeniaca TaxID=36596 RepID=A0A6J5VTV7_PRUAR|nr:unnamed protein product [Prunus armeniaca]CAB4322108.1 unnamed protein product [Prunus armeniaca]